MLGMSLTIPDEILRSAGMSEREAKVEIACRLYEAEKLQLWPAAQWAGLSRTEFEAELLERKIPVYRLTEQDFETDLSSLRKLDGA